MTRPDPATEAGKHHDRSDRPDGQAAKDRNRGPAHPIPSQRVVPRIDAIEAQKLEIEATVQRAQERVGELQKHYRALEADSQQDLARIKKRETSLSSVKTNKEYQAFLKEIEDLKARNSQHEDQILACLEQIDALEAERAARKAESTALRADLEAEKVAIIDEADRRRQQLDRLETERGGLAALLAPERLREFTSLLEQKGGVAIAPVTNAVCHGCHMNIPAQMYNELQRGDSLKFCPFCARMIYWPHE